MSANAEQYLSIRPSELHFLETRFWPVEPALKATSTALQHVQALSSRMSMIVPDSSDLFERTPCFTESVSNVCNEIEALIDNVQVLLRICASTSRVLEQVAESKNQHISQEQNKHVASLTRLTANDSVTIRVITVITLVYLSSTAVAVSA